MDDPGYRMMGSWRLEAGGWSLESGVWRPQLLILHDNGTGFVLTCWVTQVASDLTKRPICSSLCLSSARCGQMCNRHSLINSTYVCCFVSTTPILWSQYLWTLDDYHWLGKLQGGGQSRSSLPPLSNQLVKFSRGNVARFTPSQLYYQRPPVRHPSGPTT